jgi:hypothetical protein
MIDLFLVKASFAFLPYNPNPYFILSVLISAIYGLRVSIVTSLSCSLIYLLMLHLNLNYDEVETLFDFHYLSTPLVLTMTSLVIGELREHSTKNVKLLNLAVQDTSKIQEHLKAKDIVQVKEINELKKRLVSRLETVRSFHDIATSFQSVDETILLQNFTEALSRLFKTSSIQFFIVKEAEQSVHQWHGVLSIQFKDLDSLSQEALRLKKQATLEDVYSLKNFNLSQDASLIAIPLLLDGKIEFLVQIKDIPFLDYIPSNFKISDLYNKWVSSSLVYGRNYQNSMRNNIWNDQLQVYQYNYFHDRVTEEFNRSKAYMLPLSLLKIKVDSFDGISTSKSLTIRKLICGLLAKSIRKLDYITEGKDQSEYLVVFPIFDAKSVEETWKNIESEFKKLNIQGDEHPIKLTALVKEFNPSMNSMEEFAGEFI